MFKSLMDKVLGKKLIPYDEAKKLARHEDEKVRLKLAQREDLMPEILYFLAEDTCPKVRLAIAKNISSPRQADLLLSRDQDDGVRTGLAGKIDAILPDLTNDEMDVIQKATHEVIKILAHDQATRVRRILSETLKDIAQAPSDVILMLARDVELVVCAPVLENSPVLTEEDIVNIVASGPVKGALSVISRRRDISESITDAISNTDDVDAISEMLGNTSAQIREDTLDILISRAEGIEPWHKPMVNRPKLSRSAVLRLAEFVADNLLDSLRDRPDIDPHTAEAVREEFSRRIESAERSRNRDEGGPPEERARKLFAKGKLNDVAIHEAAQAAEIEFVKVSLALKTKLTPNSVTNIFELASVKGIISMCWKAQLSMTTAVAIQKRIAKIPPRDVQGSFDGQYPYTIEEMEWQLDFFQDSA
ncbi:MAG: DUF2336 domain-containing protein [Magnetovibrio sp.]|nr:DUF2336 domain-containing protein [Magnetovibrio sp.]